MFLIRFPTESIYKRTILRWLGMGRTHEVNFFKQKPLDSTLTITHIGTLFHLMEGDVKVADGVYSPD